jgi:hypothetical protein
MPYAWNDSFTDLGEVFSLDFQTMFWTAYNERRYAIATSAGTAGVVALPTVGSAMTAYKLSTLQGWLETNCTSFVDTSLSLTSPAYGGNVSSPTQGWTWTLASWRTAAGINASGFRRKRPREITSTSATTDFVGNARATGHVAWLRPSPGGIWRFDGTSWVNVDSQGYLPDVLDSDLAAPFHMPYGIAQNGDYHFAEAYNQVRDGFNLLTRTLTDNFNFYTDGSGTFNRVLQKRGGATTIAAAQAAWSAASPTSVSFIPVAPSGLRVYTIRSEYVSSTTNFIITTTDGQYGIPSYYRGAPSTINFLWFDAGMELDVPPPNGNYYHFDDNGTGILFNAWSRYEAKSVTATSVGSYTQVLSNTTSFRDITTLPAQVTAVAGQNRALGTYIVVVTISEWDFVYGP